MQPLEGVGPPLGAEAPNLDGVGCDDDLRQLVDPIGVGAVGNNAQALSALDGNPRPDAAFEEAESCQRLRSIRPPGRTPAS